MNNNSTFKKLEDISKICLGLTHTPNYVEKGVPFLSVKDITKGQISFENTKYISHDEFVNAPTGAKPQKGDILFGRVGTIGQPQIVTSDIEFCIFVSLGFLKIIDKNVKNTYVRYWMLSQSFFRQVKENIQGIAIKNLNTGWLKNFILPIPTLPIQQQIVSELDALSDIISKKKQQLEELDKLAQATFYDMFGDPVSNEKGWEVKPLNKITKVGTGGTPSRKREQDFYNGSINWAKTTEVKGKYIFDTEEKITELALIESNCKVYPIGTILLAMYGQGKTRGNVGFLKIEAATNQACATIPPTEEVNQIFIFELLKNSYEYLRGLARGGNQENLNLNIVGNIKIIIPPKSVQTLFATKIESIEKQKTLINQSIGDVQQLFDYTMDKYFN
jgi:type I restriction enzyme S subunit